MNRKEDYDSYEIEEPSDEERAESSSEDELDVLLNGTQEQKRKLIREYLTGESEPSSEDEFEKEMEAELSSTMKTMECQWGAPADSGTASSASATSTSAPATAPPQLYDSIYFDSDSDEDERSGNSASCRAKQRRILTNDELLYDPDKDNLDQAWVDAQRKMYSKCRAKRSAAGRGAPSQTLPSSDAILNCPACMTTLCLDCQRHEKYRTQYRAMFVMNCTINKEEVLRYKTPNDKQRRNRRKRRAGCQEAAPAGAEPEETYHPVQCTECATEVAVFDKDEVYHFFNILASHC
ncbi:E2F-associated phosphoprotein [Brienomyrus brachyistius]|uniref:E2F-associated phosphoprotein n=1 Tax=Brienomyrus brachyistius TaxID=42636 RepID=UPI0020B29B9A|nr:E2F-associated phosphoprotein [Brienomyrus brachyistius]